MSERQGSELGIAMSRLAGIVVLVAAVYALTTVQFSTSRDLGTPERIAARIPPAGSANLAGAEAAAPSPATASATADEGPGAAIYNKACTACHASGAAGAPKLGDKAAWEPRVAQGVEQLLRTSIDGKGAMPPRGTCMDCSDDDLNVAIEYMLIQVGYEPAVPAVAGDTTSADSMSGMEGMEGMSAMQREQARKYQSGVH